MGLAASAGEADGPVERDPPRLGAQGDDASGNLAQVAVGVVKELGHGGPREGEGAGSSRSIPAGAIPSEWR
jgi:hypothetical protein